MASNLRTHIAPVGFEFRRVTDPLIHMQADKVYLLTYEKDDRVAKFLSEIKKKLADSYIHIQVNEVLLDVWDLYSCIEKFRELIHKEKGNHVYVNVSTGTKITAIAGMLSCMMWHAQPYYVSVAYPEETPETIPTEHIQETSVFPTYDIKKPKPEFMLILNLLQSYKSPIRKSVLIEKLEEIGVIRRMSDSGMELKATAKHSQLRVLLDPMEKEWKLIMVRASGRRSEVSMTQQGKTALRVFGYGEDGTVENLGTNFQV